MPALAETAFRAELIAIGDELLSGEVVDTNSSYIDQKLEHIGWTVGRHTAVSDTVESVVEAMREASGRSRLILTTGGLGPTEDDRTFEAVALAAGVELVRHEETYQRLQALLSARGAGRDLQQALLKRERQVMLPKGCRVIVNEAGTAPCIRITIGEATLYAMPGVPREMRWLMENRIVPELPIQPAIRRRTVRTSGIAESQLEERVQSVVRAFPDVRFGFRTRLGENDVKLMAEGAKAEARISEAEAAVRHALLEDALDPDADASVEHTVLARLRAGNVTLSVAESCTGGLLLDRLISVAGASAVVMGGVVAYDNRAKVTLAGVSERALAEHGAVSKAVAVELAEGIRKRLCTDWGLSTTGIAGPGGGTPDKPVGTVWIALAGPTGTKAELLKLNGLDRSAVRTRTVKTVLDRLRRLIASTAA